MVKEDKIYLNVGKRNGVHSGDSFPVYRPGESIVDQGTGEVLGSEDEQIGVVRISQIKETFSTATEVQGGNILKRDIIGSR